MTTIAYDGRYIAVDSRVSQDNRIVNDECDKFIIRTGWVFFLTGNLAIQKEFIDCFCNGSSYRKKGAIGAIGFNETDGLVYDFNHGDDQFDLCHLYHKEAIGSGMHYAIAAMDFGRSAVDAVKYASTRDMYTGGSIRCFDTRTGKFIKVK